MTFDDQFSPQQPAGAAVQLVGCATTLAMRERRLAKERRCLGRVVSQLAKLVRAMHSRELNRSDQLRNRRLRHATDG